MEQKSEKSIKSKNRNFDFFLNFVKIAIIFCKHLPSAKNCIYKTNDTNTFW